MPHPKVTVLIDTYNHERFVERAITSVIEQDFPPDEIEILVVDDGSTDATPTIVKRFAPRVTYIRKENGGQASAFNLGIPQARGEIIAFLDGDDWWQRNKLSAVVEALERNPEAGVAGHGIFQIDSATGNGSALTPQQPGYFDLRSNEGAQKFRNFMCFLGTSRVAIRRGLLENVLPIPESLVVEADEFMSAVAIAYGGAYLLAEPLTYYRLHDQNQYQFRGGDTSRRRRKMNSLASLEHELPPRLAAAGVLASAVNIIIEPIHIATAQMKLILDGGMPWETYRVERAAFRLAYSRTTPGYRAWKEFVLAVTLCMPPSWFYRLRDWYSERNLRRFRGAVGEPVPAAPIRDVPIEHRGG
jgi:cellulose synthase/poly-beta-1,6-N-acetylglucosamine synthase-like glycosyltransferase